MITIFQVLPVTRLALGAMAGANLGSRLGTASGIVGGIIGGGVGLVCGRLPFLLVLKFLQRDFSRNTTEQLRTMLRDPAFLAPNVVLLELGSRGEDLECELPVVLEMLTATDRERRSRGWHALESAFPKRAKALSDYRIDDSLDECRRKVQGLRDAEPNISPNDGSAMPTGDPGGV